jgi:hypothetical protein
MYLASPRTSSSWTPFRNPLRVGTGFTDAFTGSFVALRREQRFTDFYGFSLRIWNTAFSFVCFEHCAERGLCPSRQIFHGFEPVRCPTYCPDDRALRRHTHSIPPQHEVNLGKEARYGHQNTEISSKMSNRTTDMFLLNVCDAVDFCQVC